VRRPLARPNRPSIPQRATGIGVSPVTGESMARAMRFTRNEIILAMRFRIAVVVRRAREPSFISATPFHADGSAGGAVRRGARYNSSDYAFARNARLNDGPSG